MDAIRIQCDVGYSTEMKTESIRIRRLQKTDIPFALEQTAREGWDTTAPFIEMLLAHDPESAFLATIHEQPAGMITATRYVESAWIGNLIVPPEFRKGSIGSQLMNHVIQGLEKQGAVTLRLEADPLGINIYRRFGFIDEFDSPRFRITDYNFTSPSSVETLAEHDLADIVELDRRSFGDERSRILNLLFRDRAAAFKLNRAGRIAGYLFVQHSAAGFRLGPWIAEDAEIAHDLLRAALSFTRPTPVIVAIPGANPDGIKVLETCGFQQTPSSLRMRRGPEAAAGLPQNVYGLAGGAIG